MFPVTTSPAGGKSGAQSRSPCHRWGLAGSLSTVAQQACPTSLPPPLDWEGLLSARGTHVVTSGEHVPQGLSSRKAAPRAAPSTGSGGGSWGSGSGLGVSWPSCTCLAGGDRGSEWRSPQPSTPQPIPAPWGPETRVPPSRPGSPRPGRAARVGQPLPKMPQRLSAQRTGQRRCCQGRGLSRVGLEGSFAAPPHCQHGVPTPVFGGGLGPQAQA